MTRRRRIERINSAKQELKSLVKQMNQAAEFAENLVQRRSAADIIQNKNELKLGELRGVEVPKHRQDIFVKFTAASQHNFKLGSIQVSENRQSQLNQLWKDWVKLSRLVYKQS